MAFLGHILHLVMVQHQVASSSESSEVARRQRPIFASVILSSVLEPDL